MSNWSRPRGNETDEELKAADMLLDKADALLRRHRGMEPQHTSQPEADVFISLEEDDLPLLTEVVDPSELPAPASAQTSIQASASAPVPTPTPTPTSAPAPAPEPRPATPHVQPVSQLAEQLISLDTEIARAVESWFAAELPQLLSRELDKLSARLQEEALRHLRATLLPTLSEHISRSLEKNTDITD
ncbi:hypothetical protein [Azoarcus sp. KH32C]|uniref:hypothetical protein n=1 Tax=Azoarcus sp. KH32C TaxID=748247 RepID=UPI0002386FE2|nr:hypothetical protein [Azoarcus sp. KH32C]BAL23959.1 hypothetical protein AZKH_1643 [Azoarcus sp. KH32C]